MNNEICKKELFLYMLIFVFGGLFGFLYEELFYRIDLGYFVKRGTTFGPWIPIYGFGAIGIMLSTKRIRNKPLLVFLVSCLVTGLLEYFTGMVLYQVFDTRLWDYNVEIWNWGNIQGYICARSILFFGISALFLQYCVYPLLSYIADYVKDRTLRFFALTGFGLFGFDILLSMLVRLVNR